MVHAEFQTANLNVVHQVRGARDVIEFLRRGSQLMIERLFYFAKRDGRSTFFYKDDEYSIIRNRDLSYTISKIEEDHGSAMGLV